MSKKTNNLTKEGENQEMKKEIKILQHTVRYFYYNKQDMPEYEQEHVKGMIAEGYTQGELNDHGAGGWWAIENVLDVQLDYFILLTNQLSQENTLLKAQVSSLLEERGKVIELINKTFSKTHGGKHE